MTMMITADNLHAEGFCDHERAEVERRLCDHERAEVERSTMGTTRLSVLSLSCAASKRVRR